MSNFVRKIFDLPARTIFSSLIIFLPICLLVYAVITRANIPKSPKATQGNLDLSETDLVHGDNVRLDGEWLFFWNQLLEPSDFDSTAEQASEVITVPGIWNGHELNGKKLDGSGYATFKLHIKLKEPNDIYALKILTVSNAYKLWIDGNLIAENGVVSADKDSYHPEYRPQVVAFSPTSQDVEIVVQISNFHHWKGGFWHPIKLGSFENIQREYNSRTLLEIFLFGCLFIMAVYHFGLFFLRRKDPSTLYFGLMCAVICFRSLLTGENLINYVIPDLDWFVARKVEYLLTFVTVPVYMGFARSLYPNEINTYVYRALMFFGIFLCAFTLFAPIDIFTFLSYIFSPYSWIAGVCAIYVFVMAARREREGAELFLATSLFFLITIFNDALNQTEFIHTGLYLPFGLLMVVFAQSFILSSRSANAYRNLEIYAKTFQKFVPSQFLNKIAKDGIESIKLGNAQKEEVTVIFSDIRAFTALSENMTPSETFKLLNKYLSYVEPPIRENHGFVDKYMGDGIMALFEKEPEGNSAHNALLAALEMRKALSRYNETRKASSKAILQAGIGVHSGSVIIGTLGGEERMDSTAIGDAVNLASRIEGMTKIYGVPILVSDDTIQLLDTRDEFIIRFVDKAMAKGKSEPVVIWEVMGKANEISSEMKIQWLPMFETAMDNYWQGRLQDAKMQFESCLQIYKDDPVAEIYLKRCTEISAS